MKFRDWIINEEFGEGGASWDLLYPTTAGDYMNVNNDPREHFYLQWKWDRGTDPNIGRVLHNIDNESFQKIGYVGIESTTMPNGDEPWKHKADDSNSSSIKPYFLQDLKWIAIGKTSNETQFLDQETAGNVRIWPTHGPTEVLDDSNLDAIFHDADTHSHKWPDIDEKYMDSKWTKKFEAYVTEYGLASGGAAGLPWSGHFSDGETNRTMPVKSKWVTKDGKNDADDSDILPDPDISFGYKGRPEDKKKRLKGVNRNRNIRPKRIDVSDIIY